MVALIADKIAGILRCGLPMTAVDLGKAAGCSPQYAAKIALREGVVLAKGIEGRPRKKGDLINLIRQTFSYDPSTGEVLRDGVVAGWVAEHGYRVAMCHGRKVYAHRIAWALHHGSFPRGLVDHINGDKLDNRICNLRECSPSQNSANSRKSARADATSPFKGVSINRRTRRWRARITVDGRERGLGTYDTQEEASLAYASGAKRFFGEFARAGKQAALGAAHGDEAVA